MDWKTIKEQLIHSDNFIRNELAELHPVPELNGTRYKLNCPNPACGKREAYLYSNGEYICCNRQNKCGEKTSVFDYIATKRGYSTAADDFVRMLKDICKEYGIDCTEDTEQMKAYFATQRQAKDLLKAAHDIFRKALYETEGKETLDYLHNVRHWNDTEIKEAGLGYNIGAKALREQLGLEGKAFPETLKYIAERDAHKITLPDYDQYGELRAIWGRRTDGIEKDKYKPFGDSSGTKGVVPSGLNIKQAKASKIIAVEGWLDWLRCKANGMNNVITAGTSKLNDNQIQALKTICPEAVIVVAMDQDNAGVQGNVRTVSNLINNNMDCVVAQLPNDPDGIVKDYRIKNRTNKGGIEEFISYTEDGTATNAGIYLATQAIAPFDLTTETGRAQAEKKLRLLCLNVEDRKVREDIEVFYDKNEAFTHSVDSFREDIEREWQQRVTEKANADIQQTLRLIQTAATPDKKFEIMKATVSKIERENVNKRIPQPEPYTLDCYKEDIEKTERFNGYKTGFRDFDALGIKIPDGGITIITARPAECKTTFMLNLLVNLTKQYPEKCFVYASYEERTTDILRKVFSAYTGYSPTDAQIALQFPEDKARQLLYDRFDMDEVENLIIQSKRFNELLTSHRLFIINRADKYTASDIKYIVEQEIDNGHEIGALIVDYMQKIKVERGTESNSQRTYQIEATSEVLRSLATDKNIAVIVGAQANRDTAKERKEASCFPELHKIKDAGSIEQDAALVIGIACPAKHTNAFTEITSDLILKDYSTAKPDRTPDRTLICAKILKRRNEVEIQHIFCFAFGPSIQLEKLTDPKEAEKLAEQIHKMTTGKANGKKKKDQKDTDEDNNAAIDDVTQQKGKQQEPEQAYLGDMGGADKREQDIYDAFPLDNKYTGSSKQQLMDLVKKANASK